MGLRATVHAVQPFRLYNQYMKILLPFRKNIYNIYYIYTYNPSGRLNLFIHLFVRSFFIFVVSLHNLNKIQSVLVLHSLFKHLILAELNCNPH